MGERAVQVGIVAVVIVGLGLVVISNADGWADWVVFGVIIVTTLGFAIAVAPNLYARRKRTISRSGGVTRGSDGPGGRPR
jgi:hypothetical protein